MVYPDMQTGDLLQLGLMLLRVGGATRKSYDCGSSLDEVRDHKRNLWQLVNLAVLRCDEFLRVSAQPVHQNAKSRETATLKPLETMAGRQGFEPR